MERVPESATPERDLRHCSDRTNHTLVSYSYRAYGLGINSLSPIQALESALSDLPQSDLEFEDGFEPDWTRALLSLPAKILARKLEPPGVAEPSFVLTQRGEEQGFELDYSDGARFVVDGAAKRVWGSYRPPLTADDMAVYFLGPVMGFLLRRRHITCLHSSAVEFRGHAICLCGDAGVGKSTTAAALALRGLPVMAEDIVPLEETEQGFLAVPGYPRVCLWPESVQMLAGSSDALPLISAGWEKRYLPLDGKCAKFAAGKLPLGLVYVFANRVDDAGGPRIERLTPRDALLELVRNTYMNWVLGREQRAIEFETLCRLVEQTPVRRIVPHADPGELAGLCDLILRDAGEFLETQPNPPRPLPR